MEKLIIFPNLAGKFANVRQMQGYYALLLQQGA